MSQTVFRGFLLAVTFTSLLGSGLAAAGKRPLWAEDFEADAQDGAARQLALHPLLKIAEGEGVGGGNALRAIYQGYEQGSRRMVVRVPLPEAGEEMTLCYDVRFPEGFQFVRGGKLHGLGPQRPVSGGNEMVPEGWSARVNFGQNGMIRTYLYVQNKSGRYGQSRGNPTRGSSFAPVTVRKA
jgi:hypothetical protein